MKKMLLLVAAAFLAASCVSPNNSKMTKNAPKALWEVQRDKLVAEQAEQEIKKNNENLLKMRIGFSYGDVINTMGYTKRDYEPWPGVHVLLYRTGMSSGINGKSNADFTSVVVSDNKCIGWGRNFHSKDKD